MAVGNPNISGPIWRRRLTGSVWRRESERERNIGTVADRAGKHVDGESYINPTTTITTTTTTTT
jgi:hypothetical protein